MRVAAEDAAEEEAEVAVAAEEEAEVAVAAEAEAGGGVPTASGSGRCGFATEARKVRNPGRGDAAPSTGAQVAHPGSEYTVRIVSPAALGTHGRAGPLNFIAYLRRTESQLE